MTALIMLKPSRNFKQQFTRTMQSNENDRFASISKKTVPPLYRRTLPLFITVQLSLMHQNVLYLNDALRRSCQIHRNVQSFHQSAFHKRFF